MIERGLIDWKLSYQSLNSVRINFDEPLSVNNSNFLRNLNNYSIRESDYECFHHELSPFTEPKEVFKLGQTSSEIRVYRQFKGSRIDLNSLIDMNDILTDFRGGIRQGDLMLKSEKHNELVKFPSIAQAKSRIFDIIKFIDCQCEFSIKDAIFVYVLLLNSHVFNDGNGRLARVVFNLLVAKSEQFYLPIYEIKEMSKGGYEIRLRRAEIFDDWNPICNFFDNCIKLCEKYN
jgi:hypothetical protein